MPANHPESGPVSYSYDAKGNLATKKDARNLTITYNYDALNRLTQKSYSDGTLPAHYHYDETTGAFGGTLTNSVGRLTYSTSGGIGGSVFDYDVACPVTFTGPFPVSHFYNTRAS